MSFSEIKRFIMLAVVAVAVVLLPSYVAAKTVDSSGKAKFTLCLDPGHGGKDYGCIGDKTNEKTIVLNVATRVKQLINKHLADYVNVVMTRDADYYVTLQGRADIANQNHSDLFISVHVNSVAKTNAHRTTIAGCQVYTLGLHKSAENLAVAKRENAAMEMEPDHKERYGDFDPNSLEGDILFELTQSKRMDQSIELADAIHNNLSTTASRKQMGVRQAGFWVLWATSMPAVLVELDFICNPESEAYLDSEKGCDQMAEAIYNAIGSYLNTYGPSLLGRPVNAKLL
jgi:N-acetylmuramoyl-L-alanine amidase